MNRTRDDVIFLAQQHGGNVFYNENFDHEADKSGGYPLMGVARFRWLMFYESLATDEEREVAEKAFKFGYEN